MAGAISGDKTIRQWWQDISDEYSFGQKVVFVLTAILIIAGFIFLLKWATRPDYVALYGDMDLKDGDQIVEILRGEGVPYRLSNGGKAILVPSNKVYELRMRLASEGLPRSGNIGYEIFDKKEIGVSEFVQSVNFQRALEGELSRTVQALAEIQYARVHLVFPKERLFKEDQQEATASVLLKMDSNAKLSDNKVQGIANLVANSVEGLNVENVTIVDAAGEILSKSWNQNDAIGLTENQLDIQRSVENHLQQKAQSMLDRVLGSDNSIVRVSAVLNFQQIDRHDETYDPENTAVLSEDISEESGNDTSGQNIVRSERSVTNYKVNKSVQHIIESVGDIRSLSLSVIANGSYQEMQSAEGTVTSEYVPRSQDEMTMLEAVVKNAVGFSEERGDKFEIQNLRFDTTTFAGDNEWVQTLAEKERREFYLSVGQKVLVGVLLLLMLLFIRSKLKKVKASFLVPSRTVQKAGQTAQQMTEQAAPQMEDGPIPEIETGLTEKGKARSVLEKQISNFVLDKPAISARLLRYWLVEE